MKRILALLLALVTLFSFAACSSELAIEETVEASTKEETKTAEKEEDGEIVLPEGFSAGFGREDVTPYGFDVRMNSTCTATSVADPIFATCVAVSDGKEVALLFSLDIRNTTKAAQMMKIVSRDTGVPQENMFFNATHNHSGPDPTSESPEIIRWYTDFYAKLSKAAFTAMRDLSPAKMFLGKADSPAGTSFVRRYQRADGSWDGIHNGNDSTAPVVAYESEADKELRTIRFEREEGKDILLANWQAHAAHALSSDNDVITADFITNMRNGVEKELDCHFAYYQGAAGDVNFSTQIAADRVYSGWEEIGEVLVDTVKEAVEGEKEGETGKLQITKYILNGTVKKDSEERLAQAMEVNRCSNETEQAALQAKYGFESRFDYSAVITRSKMGETSELPLSVITFGDVGFASAPCEMFSSTGKALREASPYPTTFTCSYTNGACGYMPSSEAWPHGGYEVYICYFVQGTGEQIANESVRILKEHFANK